MHTLQLGIGLILHLPVFCVTEKSIKNFNYNELFLMFCHLSRVNLPNYNHMCKLHSNYTHNFQDINPSTYFLKNILLSDCKKCIIDQRDRSRTNNQNDKARNIKLKSNLINELNQALILIVI